MLLLEVKPQPRNTMANQDEFESGARVLPETTDNEKRPQYDEKESDTEVDSNTGGYRGIEKMQALTQAWTKPWLIAAYLLYVYFLLM